MTDYQKRWNQEILGEDIGPLLVGDIVYRNQFEDDGFGNMIFVDCESRQSRICHTYRVEYQ